MEITRKYMQKIHDDAVQKYGIERLKDPVTIKIIDRRGYFLAGFVCVCLCIAIKFVTPIGYLEKPSSEMVYQVQQYFK